MGFKIGKGWPKKAAKRGLEKDMSPRGSEACPSMPQQPPREPQESPRRAQGEPQESPKRAPREPQESPKRTPRALQEDRKRVTRDPARSNLKASSPPVA